MRKNEFAQYDVQLYMYIQRITDTRNVAEISVWQKQFRTFAGGKDVDA